MEPDSIGIESHPTLLLVAAIVLLIPGVIALSVPRTVQRMAQRSYEANRFSRLLPFSRFAFAVQFPPAMRALGVACAVVGILFLVLWLLTLGATGPL
jgi:uncharacterized protein YjeT (DUF2065 family)